VAEAIAGQYPSPRSLVDAYNRLANDKECQELLQNIEVRRDAGILSSTRKVGAELSKKIHRFLTSKSPEDII